MSESSNLLSLPLCIIVGCSVTSVRKDLTLDTPGLLFLCILLLIHCTEFSPYCEENIAPVKQ